MTPTHTIEIGPYSLTVPHEITPYVAWHLAQWNAATDNVDLLDTVCSVNLPLVLHLARQHELPVVLCADLVKSVGRHADLRPADAATVLVAALAHPAPAVQYEALNALEDMWHCGELAGLPGLTDDVKGLLARGVLPVAVPSWLRRLAELRLTA